MSDEISLLPTELRGREDKAKASSSVDAEPRSMHLPLQDGTEIIEIEEEEEPKGVRALLGKISRGFKTVAEQLRLMLRHSEEEIESPAKAPPEAFFHPQPQRPSSAPSNSPSSAPKSPIPHRVVVKRIHKPVHVSLLDAEAEALIDLPKRKFTFFLLMFVFCALLGGSFALLEWQTARAEGGLEELRSQTQDVQQRSKERQQMWEGFQDLEPRLRALSQLLDRHLAPTLLLDRLAAATLPDVFYTSMTLAPDGHLTLSVVAPSFETAARQVVALRNSAVASRVEAMGYQASYAPQGALEKVAFQIQLRLQASSLRAGEATLQAATSGL